MKIVFLFLVLICSVTSISAEKKNNTEIVDFSKCLLGNSQLLKDLMKLKDTKKQDLINVLLEIVPRDVQIIFGCYDKHLKGKKINIVPSLMAVFALVSSMSGSSLTIGSFDFAIAFLGVSYYYNFHRARHNPSHNLIHS